MGGRGASSGIGGTVQTLTYKMKGNKGKTITAKVYNSPPAGWKEVKGAMTAPNGYTLYSNNKSHFSGEREQALVKNRRKRKE